MRKPVLEVCANGIQSALNAQEAGVDRIELCSHLEAGGITPSYEIIQKTIELLKIPVHILIRPRPGDFVYTDDEFEQMRNDIFMCRKSGAHGVVFGILNKDKTVDIKRCAELRARSSPLQVIFHRAFDIVSDPILALDQIIDLSFTGLLTSGQRETCLEGSDLISQLVKVNTGDHNDFTIIAGGGISEENIAEVVKRTGASEFHFSAKVALPDGSLISDLNRIRIIKEIAEDAYVEREETY